MTNLLQYLLEVNIYLALAYGGYWLLLRRQTFYSANRVYLLASALLCFAIPLVQISFASPQAPAVTQVLVQEVFMEDLQAAAPTPQPQAVFEPFKALTALYITGAILGFVLLCAKLYRLLKLIFISRRQKSDGYTLILMPETPSPFSFMGYLFVADEEQLQPVILKHELVHITQKHSYDVLFTELLKIACWFNPAVYLLQNSLKTIHEFEADRLTAGNTEQDGYVDFLIAQACHNSGLSFANHFSEKQLLKSRIMKLYQKRSGSLARLNYLMALPLCAGMLAASSLAFSKDYGLKLELGKTPEKNLNIASITNYASENKTNLPETNFPEPTVRSDDGKVNSNIGGEFKSVIEPRKKSPEKIKDSTARQKAVEALHDQQKYLGTLLSRLSNSEATPKDSVKKLRLKVTSGNTSSVTNKLKLTDAKGKERTYTAQNFTAKDKQELKQSLGIDVEIVSTSAMVTSIITLPPPPPIDPKNPKKFRRPIIPQPPLPPPPPLESKTAATAPLKPKADSTSKVFADMFKHLSRKMRYPKSASDNNITGVVMATFKVDNNQRVTDAAIKKSTHPDLDAEALKNLSSYANTVTAKPGVYFLKINYELEIGDGKRLKSTPKLAVGEKELPTVGEIVVVAYTTAASTAQPQTKSDTSSKTTRALKIRRPVLGNVIIGNKPEPVLMFNAKSGAYIRPQLVYIQIDKGTILDHATDGTAKHSANLVYLINGKIYTVEELEKRSAAIMQSGKIQTLFHAEKMICHEVDNKKMLAKYGQIAKNGVWEFENVYWSKI